MYIGKTKKIVYIYCEGKSERNYFEALKRNTIISKNYVLKPNFSENDLMNAIKKSEGLDGIDSIVVFVYDSDRYKSDKKITEEIKIKQENIYFNDDDFEDFLNCHKTKPPYKDKKPNLSRQMISEISNLNKVFIEVNMKKPRAFKNFKSLYDFLVELFDEKI